jgi:hypothetical protein
MLWSKEIANALFPNDEFDRKAETIKILTEYYPHAKQAILMLEVYSKTRSKRAVYELRDTFDHISIALNDAEVPPAEARRHFAECFTHLRRAAIEPYEWLAERKFLEIERILVNGYWLYKLLGLAPPSATNLMEDLKKIANTIVEGRVAKGTQDCLDLMKSANEQAEDLLSKLRPKDFNDRIFHILLGLVMVAGGFLLDRAWIHWFPK